MCNSPLRATQPTDKLNVAQRIPPAVTKAPLEAWDYCHDHTDGADWEHTKTAAFDKGGARRKTSMTQG